MKVLKASVLYFALVFGAGFALGTLRTLFVVPRVGTRTAELLELPFMLVITILAARWTVQRLAVPPQRSVRLRVGFLGLAFMLVAEFGLVLWLRGLTLKQYAASRDPVSGTAYYVMLGIFAIMPLLAGK